MKKTFSFLLLFVLVPLAKANPEYRIIPQVLEAIRSYTFDEEGALPLAPEIARTRALLADNKISKSYLKKLLKDGYQNSIEEKFLKQKDIPLIPSKEIAEQMAISLEMAKISVIEESDDFFDDDIYAYFLITDGFLTTAKVTETYKNVDQGEAFFLSLKDRKLFPLTGDLMAKGLTNHLIIDMGIVESDGDDVAEAKKITSIIIDIAIVIIASQSPDIGAEIAKLRKEIKALADFFNDLNKDDRLITDTIILDEASLKEMLPAGRTIHQFSKDYSGADRWSEWKYQVLFRLTK